MASNSLVFKFLALSAVSRRKVLQPRLEAGRSFVQRCPCVCCHQHWLCVFCPWACSWGSASCSSLGFTGVWKARLNPGFSKCLDTSLPADLLPVLLLHLCWLGDQKLAFFHCCCGFAEMVWLCIISNTGERAQLIKYNAQYLSWATRTGAQLWCPRRTWNSTLGSVYSLGWSQCALGWHFHTHVLTKAAPGSYCWPFGAVKPFSLWQMLSYHQPEFQG